MYLDDRCRGAYLSPFALARVYNSTCWCSYVLRSVVVLSPTHTNDVSIWCVACFRLITLR